jgi:hypothetical protein
MCVLEVPASPDLTPENERSCMCVLEVPASPDLAGTSFVFRRQKY